MGYLRRLGLGEASYDRFPFVAVEGHEDACSTGWDAVAERLQGAVAGLGRPRLVIAVECYIGVFEDEIRRGLERAFPDAAFHSTLAAAFLPPARIDALVEPWLGGDDPVFGRLSPLTLQDFLDPERRDQLRARVREASSLAVVYGPAALLCCDPDLVVYADLARWEAQRRQRANAVSNLGVENRELRAALQYKRSYFIDWRACDRLKRSTFERWDFLLDTNRPDEPRLVSGEAFRAGLATAAGRPFRVVPFFDPGVWGGQWMREVCQLDDEDAPNFAWCFDCVPEENSLLLGFGDERVEVPALNLVLRHPAELLGEPVYGRFGAEFPIRFDFLDTMEGQNLSFQVHPLVDYAREHFGLGYTQDESYYILDAAEDATVYLGLVDEIDPAAMLADLRTARDDPERPFPDRRHVARWPARRHDHFLIPAGTCHCSGSNSMVLEISHTPYIFTFKLWDWARLDLDGRPRPINLERGAEVIRWDRTASWVRQNLINQVETVARGDGWREERTGLYRSEFIETRRHWFSGLVQHDTAGDSVHVLNLVEGAEAVVESPSGSFAPFVVHFAETFIVPAAVGTYTIRPHGPAEGRTCATLKAFIRVNA